MRICDKCMAEVGRDRKHCPECGAPLDDSFEAVEGADREVYPLLARANLLRMRGDTKQAERVCLEILRKFPNHATANALMGDILLDQGKEEEAKQWFLSTLEIDPDNSQARARLRHLEEKPRTLAPASEERRSLASVWMWGVFLVATATLATAGFLAGKRMASGPADTEPEYVQRRLEYQTPPQVAHAARDAEILRRIASSDPSIADTIVALSFDPRRAETSLTLRAEPPFSTASLASSVVVAAAAVFKADPETMTVRAIVVGLFSGRFETILSADIRRLALQLPARPKDAKTLLENPWWHPTLRVVPQPSDIPPETPPPVPDTSGPTEQLQGALPPGNPQSETGQDRTSGP